MPLSAHGSWPSKRGSRADLPPPSNAENDPEAPDFENMADVVPAPEGMEGVWLQPEIRNHLLVRVALQQIFLPVAEK